MKRNISFTVDTDYVTPLIPAAGAAAVGAGTGSAVIAASGLTAAGMVGGGTGIGAAAGPVGMAVGAVTGLAAYGVYRAVRDVVGKNKVK